MRPLTALAILALSVSAFSSPSPDWLVGSYRLELSSELKATAQKLGMTEPYARFLIRPDGTFTYASNNNGAISATTGTVEVKDQQIHFIANGQFPRQGVKDLYGRSDNGALLVDGLRYVRSGSVDVVGTWNVRNDKSTRMVFKANKTFEFACVGATSRGKYELDGDKLTLIWTEVDGEAVEFGSMRKTIALREDGSFSIDTYRYVKG